MPEISPRESYEYFAHLDNEIEDAEGLHGWQRAIELLHQKLDHPCAFHQINIAEAWTQISRNHSSNGEPERAIEAQHKAVSAGPKAEQNPERRVCAHCGFDPSNPIGTEFLDDPELDEAFAMIDDAFSERESRRHSPTRQPSATGPRGPLAYAWFPAAEWEIAKQRWPDLLDNMPSEYSAYSKALEATFKAFKQDAVEKPAHVSPLTVDGLDVFANEHDIDPGSPDARAAFAAEILREGGAEPWPPGRNCACWCHSGLKYKRCCGPVPATPKH